MGNTARKALISKQERFATLLAENLNDQVYRRFVRPTVGLFGQISLRRPEQYRQLDQVIQSIVHGLHLENLRVWSLEGTLTYSMDETELGQGLTPPPSMGKASRGDNPIFDVEAMFPYWQALFLLRIDHGSFKLRTTYPMRIEQRHGPAEAEGVLMGVLEFSQDMSEDMMSAVRFQQLTLAVTLFGSGILFWLLLFFLRRAERDLALRMAEEQRLIMELHQHEKLAGMGRVVSSIAHEIRNPLGIISSSVELLLKRTGTKDPATTRILEATHDEAKRLSRTVSDFLDYARPRQPNAFPVDVTTVLSQALAFLGPELAARDTGIVRTGILDEPLMVSGDKDLLYRALYNIMSNAIQAMGSSGTLTVHMGRLAGTPPMVELTFHDSGPGFPPEDLARLMDPFFTTKEEGTGLGLPIVNSILTSHGGSLTLENHPAGGALVRVTLPGAEEA